jgi:hypothetical protein
MEKQGILHVVSTNRIESKNAKKYQWLVHAKNNLSSAK